MAENVKLEDIVSLCKRRGFIYQGSEVYGGLAGTWDYGPLGVSLKRNIMNLWWKTFVEDRDDMYGVDAAILMNQKVWQASGHVDTFIDPLVECNNCKSRFRVDLLIKDKEEYYSQADDFFKQYVDLITSYSHEYGKKEREELANRLAELLGVGNVPVHAHLYELVQIVQENYELSRRFLDIFPKIYLTKSQEKCPRCGMTNWNDARTFNMMFKTFVGPSATENIETSPMLDTDVSPMLDTDGSKMGGIDAHTITYEPGSVSYLRPETAQGIFTNFKNVVDSFYPDLPFGIAQMGKAFRNEISPRDFVFRSREFEQMEIEYFVHKDKWGEAFEQWRNDIKSFLVNLGLSADKVHELEVPEKERAHYSQRTIDFEFDFPHKRDELLGLAYRTDFDLKNIQDHSGKNMEYTVKGSNERLIPHVIEPSFGVERMVMAVLASSYTEDKVAGEKRVFLKLPSHLAPVRIAVFPLLKNKPELVKKAREVYEMLRQNAKDGGMPGLRSPGEVVWDDNGNIGKRYRRQDEIGTPHCVTIDFDTLQDNTVTVRNRDTTEQKRINIDNLKSVLS
jgi:glycyl-tRNA synthetase